MPLFFKTQRQKLDQAIDGLRGIPPKELDYGHRVQVSDVSTVDGVLSYLKNNATIGSFLHHMEGVQYFNIPIKKPLIKEPAVWIRVGAKPPSKGDSINEVKIYRKEPTSYPLWEPEDNPELTSRELADMGVTAKHVRSSVVKALSDIVKASKKSGKG